jgi:cellulose synthase/poly-beta-1,6-N-acetylglucosamine synthase-like glycosyltransferase
VLHDWIHWLSSINLDRLILFLLPMLLLDAPRYAVGTFMMCVYDMLLDLHGYLKGEPREKSFHHCPSVCVVLAGLNESETICSTMSSLYGTYPKMEIIVVDDGSTDGMSDVAEEFARTHENVLVIRRPQRGGKSSALNTALPFTKAEVIITVDTDSHVDETAIWEIVQPFTDSNIAAVSATVIARNPHVNLLTWLQGAEYLRTIFVGRMVSARLGILGIVSGAFGAFRRTALEQVKGWDVGPGEDGDLAMRLRKAGYQIAFTPYAQCFTNLPTSWIRLFKQRRRWDWSVVTFECRKHIDMADFRSSSFTAANFFMVAERILYNIVLQYTFWIYSAWLLCTFPSHLPFILLTNYVIYVVLELIQFLVVLYYSLNRRRDFRIGMIFPLLPFYYLYLRAATITAVTEEFLFRRSFRDNFVPERVRNATWHW